MIGNLFNLVLYQPLFNLLILLYLYLPGRDFGVAIISLTFLVRLFLYPLTAKAIKSQKIIAELQPKVQALQEKLKDDKEKQVRAIMDLYRQEKISPFSGIYPLLIQLPILIALYRLFQEGVHQGQITLLYSFVSPPDAIRTIFLGVMDLSQPSLVMALLGGITQYFQAKMIIPPKTNKNSKDFSQRLQKQMVFFLPIFTLLILFKLPAALGLYWVSNNVFSIFQQYLVYKKGKEKKA